MVPESFGASPAAVVPVPEDPAVVVPVKTSWS